MEDCPSTTEGIISFIKTGFYAFYFKDIPEEVFQEAIKFIQCSHPDNDLMHSGACNSKYDAWLMWETMALVADTVKGMVDGEMEVHPIEGAKNLYLSKRKVMDVECTWSEIKQCSSCDRPTINKIKSKAADLVKSCEDLFSMFGFGWNDEDNTKSCFKCDEKRIK